jgi:hypothetical protein
MVTLPVPTVTAYELPALSFHAEPVGSAMTTALAPAAGTGP